MLYFTGLFSYINCLL
uniref:Uncharacterized protein n=1 Tax=Anguilla anguilla TaxID=7936 RepID=A0A0E9XZ82_ANGAN